jgi:hypothetical protein
MRPYRRLRVVGNRAQLYGRPRADRPLRARTANCGKQGLSPFPGAWARSAPAAFSCGHLRVVASASLRPGGLMHVGRSESPRLGAARFPAVGPISASQAEVLRVLADDLDSPVSAASSLRGLAGVRSRRSSPPGVTCRHRAAICGLSACAGVTRSRALWPAGRACPAVVPPAPLGRSARLCRNQQLRNAAVRAARARAPAHHPRCHRRGGLWSPPSRSASICPANVPRQEASALRTRARTPRPLSAHATGSNRRNPSSSSLVPSCLTRGTADLPGGGRFSRVRAAEPAGVYHKAHPAMCGPPVF